MDRATGSDKIRTFADIPDSLGIPREMLDAIEARISKKSPVQLTQMQSEVLSHPDFWYDADGPNKNLIVQGATSSGKTLVAELLTLQYVTKLDKHVVYLVPLKALVTDKVRSFEAVNNTRKRWLRVYASSADYQDHDFEISNGSYDIAVMVYEKFFAMLGQSEQFLKDCGLIIVDEMQMLESQDRGAKLEYAITKAKHNYKNIRFLGLLTSDYDAGPLEKWLKAKPIDNRKRPVGVRERIITVNGTYWERFVPGEGDMEEEQKEPVKGQHKLDAPIQGMPGREKRNNLLRSVLRNCLSENPDAKVIIFVNTKKGCKAVAEDICDSGILKRRAVPPGELMDVLGRMDEDKDRDLFRNTLLPFGVAYHTASLPVTLREELEETFRRPEGIVRVLVATETITIGMNLPADVMIISNTQVIRSGGERVLLSPQEYKNYIGRAGRLGLTAKAGTSYLFLDNEGETIFQKYWGEYVLAKRKRIASVLDSSESYAEDCAPYYLNLLFAKEKKFYTQEDIEALQKETLSGNNISGKPFDAKNVMDILSQYHLMQAEDDYDQRQDIFGRKLTTFGDVLAPYALTLYSSRAIYHSFCLDGLSRNGKKVLGGLPLDYSADDLERHRYLLDILYRVCGMDEVRKIKITEGEGSDPLETNEQKIKLSLAIRDFLKKYREKDGDNTFWDMSLLQRFLDNEEELADWTELETMLKAILLRQWIDAKSFRDIRNSLTHGASGMVTSYSADLERLGESVSYLLEAVSRTIGTNPQRYNALEERKQKVDSADGDYSGTDTSDKYIARLSRAFYRLSKQVQYGLNEEYIMYIASRHVHGIDRNTLLDISKRAKREGYDNVLHYVNYSAALKECLSPTQIRELREKLSSRSREGNLETLLNNAKNDFSSKWIMDYIDKIAKPSAETFFDDVNSFIGRTINGRHWAEPLGTLPAIYCSMPDRDRDICILPLFLSEGNIAECELEEALTKLAALDVDPLFLPSGNDGVVHFPVASRVVTAQMFCRIVIACMYKGSDESAYLKYILSKRGKLEYKGTRNLQEDIERFLDAKTIPALNRYLKEHNLELDGSDPTFGSGGFGTVYKVHDQQNTLWALKEIKTPLDTEKKELLRRADLLEKAVANPGDVSPEEIGRALQELKGYSNRMDEYQKVLGEAIQYAKKRIESDSDAHFFRVLLFSLEGLRRRETALKMKALSETCTCIVPVKDVGFAYEESHAEYGNSVFIWMDAMENNIGQLPSVFQLIPKIGDQICRALQACHDAGLIHRDVKPENILYKGRGENLRFYLADFDTIRAISPNMTTYVGTPYYMAPEVKEGNYDYRCDIFGLGKTLLKLLCDKKIPPKMEGILDVLNRAAEPDLNKRYSSIEKFRDALRAAEKMEMQ